MITLEKRVNDKLFYGITHVYDEVYNMKEKGITIFICDDDEFYRKEEKKICCELLNNLQCNYSIISGENGESVLAFDGEIDILILDIDMPDLDGIHVKDYLEKRRLNTYIVFVTCHQEKVLDAFGLHVYAFLDKNHLDIELKKVISEIVEYQKSIYLVEDKYDSRDILYVKAEQGYLMLYLKSGDTRIIRKNLKELEEQLAKADFVRTHRSYMVNMYEIKGAITNTVVVGSDNIPVSVRMRTRVKEIYQEFSRKNARYCQ